MASKKKKAPHAGDGDALNVASWPGRDIEIHTTTIDHQARIIGRRFGLTDRSAHLVAALAFGRAA